MTDVGPFRTDIELEHHVHRGRKVSVANALVDTGADATWIPGHLLSQLGVTVERTEMYQMADGRVLTRYVGYVIVHVAGRATIDEVVFAEPNDITILGARSMEGLSLRVDPRTKQLESAGPKIVAAVAEKFGPNLNSRSFAALRMTARAQDDTQGFRDLRLNWSSQPCITTMRACSPRTACVT